MNKIAKRLQLKYHKVRRSLILNDFNPDHLFDTIKKPLSFKKIHQRARDRISWLVANSTTPL